jgi:mitogen-activated protein kinase organizer 1
MLLIIQDNSKFASCGGDKVCFLWDISSGKVLRRFQGHAHRVNAVQMNDEGTLLFSGSYDKTLQIWDLRSHMRDPVQSLTDFSDSVTSIALSRTEICASCVDGKVRTFDIRMGRMHEDDFHDPVTFLRLSYDQRCALSTCLNGVLRLTEVASGKVLQSYSG